MDGGTGGSYAELASGGVLVELERGRSDRVGGLQLVLASRGESAIRQFFGSKLNVLFFVFCCLERGRICGCACVCPHRMGDYLLHRVQNRETIADRCLR